MPNDNKTKSVNEEQGGRPLTRSRRKTTSRRTKTVLDEIAEQETRLRRETRTITVEHLEKEEKQEPETDAPEKQLADEYLTLQEKIDAISRQLTNMEAATGEDDRRPTTDDGQQDEKSEVSSQKSEEGQQATGNRQQEREADDRRQAGLHGAEEDFLKKQFFSVLEETSPVVTASTAVEPEPVSAGVAADAGAVAEIVSAPEEAKPLVAEDAEKVEPTAPEAPNSAFAEAPATEEAPATAQTAVETVPPAAQPAAEAWIAEPPQNVAAAQAGETVQKAETFFTENFEEEKPSDASERKGLVERACKIVDRALASETRRGVWNAFGVASLVLCVLVVMMWLFRVLF